MGRKRNPWVRLYTKLLQCADYMEAPLHVRVAWIAILCHASDLNSNGWLISGMIPLDANRLARIANITPKQATEAIDYLVYCKMLQRINGVLVVANWDEFQKPSDNSAGRVAKHRNCNGDTAVTVTAQEESKNIEEEAIAAAMLLSEEISRNLVEAGYKERNLNPRSWAADIEKIHRIDGIEYQTIERVIMWCQSDDFWKMNILSGSKLRKQFPRLLMEMQNENRKKAGVVDDVRFA